MLDLTVVIRKLTQGRPAAEMALSQAPAAEVAPEAQPEPGAQASAPAGGASPASVDVEKLARRVYDLMQQDLLADSRRRGKW
jgi:hypothetical protein